MEGSTAGADPGKDSAGAVHGHDLTLEVRQALF